MNRRIKKVKREYGARVTKRETSWLELLMHSSFGRRTITEAIVRPRGKVALTLRHGYQRASEILLERKRRKIGELRVVKPKEPRYKLKRR